LDSIYFIYKITNRDDIIKLFSETYIDFVKKDYQKKYKRVKKNLNDFIEKKIAELKLFREAA